MASCQYVLWGLISGGEDGTDARKKQKNVIRKKEKGEVMYMWVDKEWMLVMPDDMTSSSISVINQCWA